MAAVMFFAGGWGYFHLLALSAAAGQTAALPAGGGSLLGNTTMLEALAALLVTAVLAGLLVLTRRISPLAAGLPGLLVLAWTALYLASQRRAVNLVPLRGHAFGAGWESLLFNGVLAAAGAVLVLPMLVPSRWRGEVQAQADTAAREADQYLSDVWPDRGPQQRTGHPFGERQGEEEAALVGTVMSYPAGSPVGGPVPPVDTTRVTGASRALRATGSFRATTGSMPRTTGSFRASGSFRAANDTTLLGRPYLHGPDE
jgi:hypothetical protein